MSGRSTAATLLAAVFFAGVATTLGVLRLVENRPPPVYVQEQPRDRDDRPPGVVRRPGGLGESRRLMELARMEVSEHMNQALDLTPEQQIAIDEAMERSRVDAQGVMSEFLPRLQGQMDSLHAEIERILTPEQRAAFQDFRREDRDRFRRGPGRRFRPPGSR